MPFKSTQPDINLPTDLTIWDWLFESSFSSLHRGIPESELCGYQNAISKERINWREVRQCTKWLSTALSKDYGLQANQTVVLFSQNTIWYPVAVLGISRAGGVVTGASPASNLDEMTYVLKNAKAKFLMTSPSLIDVAVEAAKQAGIPKKRVFLLEGQEDGFTTMRELLKSGQSYGEHSQIEAFKIPEGKKNKDICAFLVFSSGTTGLPKAVMVAHQNVIAECLQMQRMTSPDLKRELSVSSAVHITGLVQTLRPCLLNVEVIMLPYFTLKGMLDTMVEYKLTDVFLWPAVLLRFVRDPIVNNYDLSRLRRFHSGAAPLFEEVIQQLKKKFPQAILKQAYGMTESCGALTAQPPDMSGYKYVRSVGKIVPSTEFMILKEDGSEGGVGEAGEIFARGPQCVMGYMNNEKATRETFLPDGWLRTGDRGLVDEEGYVTIIDRIRDMIKVNGIAVAPSELENVLLGHDYVQDAAVLGIQDTLAGELPKAYVALKPGLIADQVMGKTLVEFVQERTERHKWIKEVQFMKEIPRNIGGKIQRATLREKVSRKDESLIVREATKEKAML